MKTLKLMQLICILGMISSIGGIEKNDSCWIAVCFFIISGLFFTVGINDLERDQQIENDLYEHSNY